MRVLVIEDEPVAQTLLTAIVERLGFDVITVGTVADANRELQSEQPLDVAIIDWILPDGSGVDLVRTVRASETRSKMKLLMVTSRDDEEDVQEAVLAGADEYLMKPIENDTLMSKFELLGLVSMK